MVDITKCDGAECPHKESCYRYTAEADDNYQSYFMNAPIKDGKCNMYWGDTYQNILDQLNNIVNGIF